MSTPEDRRQVRNAVLLGLVFAGEPQKRRTHVPRAAVVNMLRTEPLYRFPQALVDDQMASLVDKGVLADAGTMVTLTKSGLRMAKDLQKRAILPKSEVAYFLDDVLEHLTPLDQATYLALLVSLLSAPDGKLQKEDIENESAFGYEFLLEPGSFRITEFFKTLCRAGVVVETLNIDDKDRRNSSNIVFLVPPELRDALVKGVRAHLGTVARTEWDEFLEAAWFDLPSELPEDDLRSAWTEVRTEQIVAMLKGRSDGGGEPNPLGNAPDGLRLFIDMARLWSLLGDEPQGPVAINLGGGLLSLKCFARYLKRVGVSGKTVAPFDPDQIDVRSGRFRRRRWRNRKKINEAGALDMARGALGKDVKLLVADKFDAALPKASTAIVAVEDLAAVRRLRDDGMLPDRAVILCRGWPVWRPAEPLVLMWNGRDIKTNTTQAPLKDCDLEDLFRHPADASIELPENVWPQIQRSILEVNMAYRKIAVEAKPEDLYEPLLFLDLAHKYAGYGEQTWLGSEAGFSDFVVDLNRALFDRGRPNRWYYAKKKSALTESQKIVGGLFAGRQGVDPPTAIRALGAGRNFSAHARRSVDVEQDPNRQSLINAVRGWSEPELANELVGKTIVEEKVRECVDVLCTSLGERQSETSEEEATWFARQLLVSLVEELAFVRAGLERAKSK